MKRRKEVILIIGIILTIVGVILIKEGKEINKIKIKYKEEAGINYRVYVNDNKYYKEEYLKEGMQYISSLIDKIEIEDKYKIEREKKIKSKLKKEVKATIKITDTVEKDKVIYEKSEILKNKERDLGERNKIEETDVIEIDYKKYNEIANDFKMKYGVSAIGNLIIEYKINEIGSYEGIEGINKEKEMHITIPLSSQMISIEKSPSEIEEGVQEKETKESGENEAEKIGSAVAIGLAIIMYGYYIVEKIEEYKKESKYERYIKKILRKYDAYITEVSKEVKIEREVVKIKSFKELLDIRNNIEKTIMYEKISETKSRFIIEDINESYVYEVSEEDIK